VKLEVKALVVVMVVVQGGFGGSSFQGQRWEKYMDLVLGLVEKEDEEVEEGASLRIK
jgi:histidinol phosphatase-like enzyme